MSKNSPTQNVEAVKLWIAWLYRTYNIKKRSPKPEDDE
jgi:hypothetical protein